MSAGRQAPVRVDFTVELDLGEWAQEYGMTEAEAREALRETARESMLIYLENNGHPATIIRR